MAHVSYTNRNLGTFDGLSAASNSITNQLTYNYGWADAADTDWGDSHKGKFYKFELTNAADVTLTAWANPTATVSSIGGLCRRSRSIRGWLSRLLTIPRLVP